MALWALDNAFMVKYGHPFSGTVIYLTDGSRYVSDNNDYFIGKTNEYVFFYHENQKTTSILPASKVQSIFFKKKNHFDLYLESINDISLKNIFKIDNKWKLKK